MFIKKCAVLAAAVTGLLALGPAGTAGGSESIAPVERPVGHATAAAEPGPFMIQNALTLYCLDSNTNGAVYMGRCASNDLGQRWVIWNGGWTKSLLTNQCLTAGTASTTAWLTGCANTPNQYWYYWGIEHPQGLSGWAKNLGLARCLETNPQEGGGALVRACYDPPQRNQLWWVNYW